MLFAAGDLDPTFSGDGRQVVPMAGAMESGMDAGVLAVGPDLKAVAVARFGPTVAPDRFKLVRVNEDGSLDTTFGGGDGVVTGEELLGPVYQGVVSVSVQPDRKVVLSGWTENYQVDALGFVMRLLPDGSPDPSFSGGDGLFQRRGSAGILTTLLPDGRILAAQDNDVLALTSAGTLDVTFGGGDGVATVPELGAIASEVMPAPGGKFLAVGSAADPGPGDNLSVIVRLNADGSTDRTFGGGDGVADLRAPGAPGGDRRDLAPTRVGVAPDGKILAGAIFLFSGRPAMVARLTPDGAVDPTWGDDGLAVLGPETAWGTWDLAVQEDGRPLITFAGDADLNVARFDTQGRPDASFGDGGVVRTNFDDTPAGEASARLPGSIELAPDGRVVAATQAAFTADRGGLLFARYLNPRSVPGALAVNGTAGADRIDVFPGAERGTLRVTVNGSTRTVALQGVTRIEVNGLGGDDRLEVADALLLPATIDGGAGNDRILGGGGNDVLVGGDGNDVMDGRRGGDVFRGGNGTDTADYTPRRNPVRVGIGGSPDDGERGEGDNVLRDVENVWGGRGNDTLRGSDANNRLAGGAGDDVLYGHGGRDTLLGGAGNDQLYARDADAADTLDGGDGTDRADADRGDRFFNVEERTTASAFFFTDFSVLALHRRSGTRTPPTRSAAG